jgi:CBS-domain-containing membrane protein
MPVAYQQLLTRRALEGESVRRFMKTDPVTVSSDLTLDRLVEDYVYRYHHKMYPVVADSNKVEGCVTTKQIKEVPKEDWNRKG